MGDLVPFRSPTPVPTGRALARAARAIARVEHPAGTATTPVVKAGPVARLLGRTFAIGEYNAQRRRQKAEAQAQLVARLEAEYQRRQRLALAPAQPRQLPRGVRGELTEGGAR